MCDKWLSGTRAFIGGALGTVLAVCVAFGAALKYKYGFCLFCAVLFTLPLLMPWGAWLAGSATAGAAGLSLFWWDYVLLFTWRTGEVTRTTLSDEFEWMLMLFVSAVFIAGFAARVLERVLQHAVSWMVQRHMRKEGGPSQAG